MKLLKLWSVFLGILAVALYVIGGISGIFNRGMGLLFWGTSAEALILMAVIVNCILLCITCAIVFSSLNKK